MSFYIHTNSDIAVNHVAADELQQPNCDNSDDDTECEGTAWRHNCRKADCPECAPRMMYHRGIEKFNKFKACIAKMQNPKFVTMFTKTAELDRQLAATGLLSDFTLLKTSLFRRGLLASSQYIVVLEFTDAGVPHVHGVIDSECSNQEIKEAIVSWSGNPTRTNASLKFLNTGCHVMNCHARITSTACSQFLRRIAATEKRPVTVAEVVAAYITKSWRDSLFHPIPVGINPSMRRHSRSEATSGRTKRAKSRVKSPFRRVKKKTTGVSKRQPVDPSTITATHRPALSVYRRDGVVAAPIPDCSLSFRELAYLSKHGSRLIQRPNLSRLTFNSRDVATIRAADTRRKAELANGQVPTDIIPPIVNRAFERSRRGFAGVHDEHPI